MAGSAYRSDDRTGEAVSLALRDALFEQGQDISAPGVLARIAEAHGIAGAGPEDARQVLNDWDDGRSRGVKGSPHFFCGGRKASALLSGWPATRPVVSTSIATPKRSTPTSPSASPADRPPPIRITFLMPREFRPGES